MDILNVIVVLLIGFSFGSFITLASYRIPRGEDIVKRPSRCPVCDQKLAVRDLFPVVSWLVNKARCRSCRAPVHWRYPVIELITAALFLTIYLRLGLTLQSGLLMALTVGLLVMCVVDFEHYLIPDEVQLFLLPLGVAYQFVVRAPWQDVAISTAFGALLGLSLRYGYQVLRGREGLGWGDVKFLAVVGVWLPVSWLPLVMWVPFLFFSGMLGVVTALAWRALKRGAVFPFGPALALALYWCVLFPEAADAFWDLQRLMYRS